MSGRIYPREIMEREIARLHLRMHGGLEHPPPTPRSWPDVYQGVKLDIIEPVPGFKLECELDGDGPWSWRTPGTPGVFGRIRG